MYRRKLHDVEVFLVHPGGPFFAHKDLGSWTVPKGEYSEEELPHLRAFARREFQEETGFPRTFSRPFLDLGSIKQGRWKDSSPHGRFEGDCDPDKLVSNLCEIEWPPRSGHRIEVPEVDRGAWFSIAEAKERIKPTQIPLLDRLSNAMNPASWRRIRKPNHTRRARATLRQPRFLRPLLFLRVFCPKNACQAPQSLNPASFFQSEN